MPRRLDNRLQVIFVSVFTLISSFIVLSLGYILVRKSRQVSENVGWKVYQIYGGAILKGITSLLPDIPGINEVIKELDIVIHDVLINDIGDTLDNTVVITGILLITFAVLQIAANSILLYGAVSRRKNLTPSFLMTRLCFLSIYLNQWVSY